MKNFKDYAYFCKSYSLQPSYGYLNDPQKEISTFNYEYFLQLLQQTSDNQFIKKINNFQEQIKLKYPDNKETHILHTMLTAILHRFVCLERKNKKDNQICLPQNFCLLLYHSSQVLNIKAAMTVNVCGNWHHNNDKYKTNPDNFSLQDFDLNWFFTNKHEQEKYFFGASIVGAYFINQVLKQCFQMQQQIESDGEVLQLIKTHLTNCSRFLKHIIKQVTKMYQKLDPIFFFHQLRPFVTKYDGLLLNGVTDDDGNQIRISNPGGTGGYDPSFQMFERALGIEFTEDYKNTQDALYKEGMIDDHRKVIDHWRGLQGENRLNIRNYCKQHEQVKKEYNQLLQNYMKFLNLHSIIIEKFIMQNIPEHCRAAATGTGNTLISKIMQRHQAIKDQFL